MGERISERGREPTGERVEAIRSWGKPQSFANLRTFLGHTTYLSNFIHRYSDRAKPLNAIRSGYSGSGGHQPSFSSVWGPQQDAAFEDLKAAITSAPVLVPPDFTKPFYIQSGASKVAIAAALLQDAHGSGQLQPVAYVSRVLQPNEVVWPAHDREFTAVRFGLQSFRGYFLPNRPTVIVDHKPLLHFREQPKLSARQIAALDEVGEIGPDWLYWPGSQMVFSDFLSRPPGVHPDLSSLTADLTTSGCPICAAQSRKDICDRHRPRILTLLHSVEHSAVHSDTGTTYAPADSRPQSPDPARIKAAYKSPQETHCRRILGGLATGRDNHFRRRYELVDGLLFTRPSVGAGPLRARPRLVLPRSSQAIIATALDSVHVTTTAGHLGVEATFQRLAQRYDFPKMQQAVEEYVRGCFACQQSRHSTQRKLGQYHGLEPPLPFPGASLSTDFTFGLPRCRHPLTGVEYNGIQVYVCRLSRRVRFLPVSETISAPEAATLYRMQVMPQWGMMASLVSDRDPRFTSAFWAELSEALGVSLKMSTANHPQTDGQSESAFGYLGVILRTFCSSNPNWVEILPDLEFAVNTHTSGSRDGRTPFQVWQGFHPLEPADLVTPNLAFRMSTPVRDHVVQQRLASQSAVECIRVAQDILATRTDAHRRSIIYQPGDKIMVHRLALLPPSPDPIHRRAKNKLLPLWSGPFSVVGMRGPNAVKVDLSQTQSKANPVFNVEATKPFHSDFRGRPDPDGLSLQPTADGEYTVGSIVGTRLRRGKRQWLVRWQGMGQAYDTWHPLENFVSAAGFTSALERFERDRTGSTDEILALHASAPSMVDYDNGTPGTLGESADGFLLRYASGSETIADIARVCDASIKNVLSLNRPNISRLRRTSTPTAGTAVRIRAVAMPARANMLSTLYTVRTHRSVSLAMQPADDDGPVKCWPPLPCCSLIW